MQQQLKLHIETIQNKLEDYEKQKHTKKYVEQIEQLKKENRRMDELITMKEEKIQKLEEQVQKYVKRAK